MKNDCIAAISTPLATGGIAVIRLSGEGVLKIAEKMFKPIGKTPVFDFEPNKMYAGEISGQGFTDFGLCVFYKAPKSFTGEDSVEFHSHGGIAIAKGVLQSAIKNGARLAERGEFTKRAFINGKLSLSSCEGMIDMINAETESQVRAGYYLYREKLTETVTEIQDKLTDALSEIDADMDYPEEDLSVDSRNTSIKCVNEAVGLIDKLLSSFKVGRTIKNGVSVGIVGKPNTGKSSLLNSLLNYDKAIVSEYAGTTRDIVEGSIVYNGVKFNLLDTAGIRDGADKIEKIGVELSKRVLETSDLIVFVLDGTDINEVDDEIYQTIKDKNHITVLNKSDIKKISDDRADITVSALKKENLDGLREIIYNKTVGNGIDINGDFLCEERHYIALNNAKTVLEKALKDIKVVPLDLLSIDLKDAWSYLGEITGKTASIEIIDNIFKKFCVGK